MYNTTTCSSTHYRMGMLLALLAFPVSMVHHKNLCTRGWLWRAMMMSSDVTGDAPTCHDENELSDSSYGPKTVSFSVFIPQLLDHLVCILVSWMYYLTAHYDQHWWLHYMQHATGCTCRSDGTQPHGGQRSSTTSTSTKACKPKR